jgi:hypothetical protein
MGVNHPSSEAEAGEEEDDDEEEEEEDEDEDEEERDNFLGDGSRRVSISRQVWRHEILNEMKTKDTMKSNNNHEDDDGVVVVVTLSDEEQPNNRNNENDVLPVVPPPPLYSPRHNNALALTTPTRETKNAASFVEESNLPIATTNSIPVDSPLVARIEHLEKELMVVKQQVHVQQQQQTHQLTLNSSAFAISTKDAKKEQDETNDSGGMAMAKKTFIPVHSTSETNVGGAASQRRVIVKEWKSKIRPTTTNSPSAGSGTATNQVIATASVPMFPDRRTIVDALEKQSPYHDSSGSRGSSRGSSRDSSRGSSRGSSGSEWTTNELVQAFSNTFASTPNGKASDEEMRRGRRTRSVRDARETKEMKSQTGRSRENKNHRRVVGSRVGVRRKVPPTSVGWASSLDHHPIVAVPTWNGTQPLKILQRGKSPLKGNPKTISIFEE